MTHAFIFKQKQEVSQSAEVLSSILREMGCPPLQLHNDEELWFGHGPLTSETYQSQPCELYYNILM